MRIRITDHRSPSEYTAYHDYSDDIHIPDTELPFAPVESVKGTYRKIQDVVTLNFRDRVNKGEIILNPCRISSSRAECTATPETTVAGPYPEWGRLSVFGDFCGVNAVYPEIPSWIDFDTEQAKSWALTKAYAGINGVQSQALVTLAELEKTISMLRHPFGHARELIGKMKHTAKRLQKIKRSVDISRDVWLEYRYGWRPFMYDIEGILKTFQSKFPSSKQNLVSRGGKTIFWQNKSVHSPTQPRSGVTCYMERNFSLKRHASAGVIYRTDFGSRLNMVRLLSGLSLADIPSLIWEVVPYSFVADWFINVGSYLEAYKPRFNVKILGNWVSLKETVDMIHTNQSVSKAVYVPPHPYVTYEKAVPGEHKYHHDILTRDVNQDQPLLPSVSISFGSMLHTLDALMLSHGAITRTLHRKHLRL
jgi:hypothetical protein